MNTIIIILSFLPLALVGMVLYFNHRTNKVIKDVDVNVKMPLSNLTKTVEEKTKAIREYIVEVSNHTDKLSNTIATYKTSHEEEHFRLASKGELKDVIARYESIWRRIDGKINLLFDKIYPGSSQQLTADLSDHLSADYIDGLGAAIDKMKANMDSNMDSPVTTPPKKSSRKPLPKKQAGVRKKVSSRRGGKGGKP